MNKKNDEQLLINIDISQCLLNNNPKILYQGEKGVLIDNDDTLLLSIKNPNYLESFSTLLDETKILVVHQAFCKDFLINKGYSLLSTCYQASFYKSKFILNLPENVEIKPLTMEELNYAHEHYHEFVGIDYLKERINNKVMWGLFLEKEICGFIGLHKEGAMGLLEIDKQHRRKSYGTYLEQFLINHLLDENKVPYCQIIEDNELSLVLQKKLGFTLAEGRVYWMKKETV